MTCVAFCDPAGGSGGDSMTLAWAHSEEKKVILDGVIEKRPPFSPRTCVQEFSEIIKRHGMNRVEGDRYSGGWVVEAFREHGIDYVVSEKTKSEIYAAFLVLANSGLVQIPLHRRLIAQFRTIQRRMLRSGRESIDHSPGAHDDLSNAAAGALVLAASTGGERFLCEVITLKAPHPTDAAELMNPANDYGFDGGSAHVASFVRRRQ